MKHPGKLFLTTPERNSLRDLHRTNRDKRVCDRIKAVLLLDNGWSYESIATALLLDKSTIIQYYRTYAEGGTESLLTLHYSGRSPLLKEVHLEQVKVYVKEKIPSTAMEIQRYIEEQFKVIYSESA